MNKTNPSTNGAALSAGDYETAIAGYNEAIRLNPNQAILYITTGASRIPEKATMTRLSPLYRDYMARSR